MFARARHLLVQMYVHAYVCAFCPCCLQVRHKGTGKEMVMKKMVRCTEEARKGFLKEVSTTEVSHPRMIEQL